jgi:group II intron reverse transcriptase/maturase
MKLPIKHHSLTGRITTDMMRQAFKNVKRNRGAAGIDKVSIGMFEANLDQNLAALMRDLKTGTLQPLPLRRVYLPKGQGRFRPLGIPAVRDRVAQDVLRQLLSPLFEPLFHCDSFGFRPQRNCHQALERVLELCQHGYHQVLDADIDQFFDSLPHAVIMQELRDVVADGNILNLVERFLKAGVLEQGIRQPTLRGTPQGGVLSPLLANIALNVLDWQLAEHGCHFVRYADDFVVLARSQEQLKEARALVERTLTPLGLTLSADKTTLTTFGQGFTFLGFEVSSRTVRMRAQSVEKLKTSVRDLTQRRHNLDAQVVRKLNAVVRGVANYFATAFSTVAHQFRTLDRWLSMRLRCMQKKRKSRRDNLRIRLKHLRRLGVVYLSDFLKRLRSKVPRFPPGGKLAGVARCPKGACR